MDRNCKHSGPNLNLENSTFRKMTASKTLTFNYLNKSQTNFIGNDTQIEKPEMLIIRFKYIQYAKYVFAHKRIILKQANYT